MIVKISLIVFKVIIFPPPFLFISINSSRYFGTKIKIRIPKPPSPAYSQKEETQKPLSPIVAYLNITPEVKGVRNTP